MNNLFTTAYAFSNDSSLYQPTCLLRGYLSIMACTGLCYSYLIQAISRLFCTALYKHKNLQTWHIHRIMIIMNWILAFLIPIPPIFLNGYVLEEESRLCLPSTKIFSSAIYVISSVFLIPLTLIQIIYVIILYYAHQSTRRVVDFATKTNTVAIRGYIPLPNFKRELILMRNMLILVFILTSGGAPFAMLIFWHVAQPGQQPESLYLLSINSITFFIMLNTITSFFMSRDVRKTTAKYLRKFCKC
jgi:hypothetical protein